MLKLLMYRNNFSFEARDPEKPNRVADFGAKIDGVTRGWNESKDAQSIPGDKFFSLDDVDWTRVPESPSRFEQKAARGTGG